MAHLFFALDEHKEAGERTTAHSGYLNGVNGNSELDADGDPRTPLQPNTLMTNITLMLSDFSKIQVGLHDSDDDTIPDILDTFPTLRGNAALSDPTTGEFHFAGEASVSPWGRWFWGAERYGQQRQRSDELLVVLSTQA